MNNLQRWPRKSLSPLFSVPGPDVSAGLVFSDEIHAIPAAIGAQGVALMSSQLIEDEVRAGRLKASRFISHIPESRRDDPTVLAVRQWVMKVPGGLCEL